MKFCNVNYLDKNFHFRHGSFTVEKGKFCSFGNDRDGRDMNGATVIPGLVDIHLHGNSGEDFSSCNEAGLQKMARFLAKNGICSFSAASLTMPLESLKQTLTVAEGFRRKKHPDCAALRGVTMEGPFFSRAKKGAQDGRYLHTPDVAFVSALEEISEDLIKIICVAPELEGAFPFIEKMSGHYRVAVAHTEAGYETGKRAFACGATHVTHLFNAMPPLNHRQPGVIAAALEKDDATVELICDGMHVHPAMIRVAYRLFGPERLCLISDALSPCGMPEGEYLLGEQTVDLKDCRITLKNGTLAGSAITVFQGMKNAISYGWSVEDAVRCATINPARVIGCDDEIGTIETGKQADFIVCDEELNIQQVYIAGQQVGQEDIAYENNRL